MKIKSTGVLLTVLFFARIGYTQTEYPQNYFRHPLNIKMELVANFGEIRTNHWHMGLDIRTQQRVNLRVYAAAEGFISRVLVEPGGFGQAIYIDHPNGFTTLYAHMNGFYPALDQYVRKQQYEKVSWHVDLKIPPGLFPVIKGTYIGLSGSTGGSQGPHVHFEIRDTKTENVLNPLLFRFPIPDAMPPTVSRLAMYDRNISTYEQSPQLLSLQKTGTVFTIPGGALRTGSNKISFAIGAVDRFSGINNPNGIFSAGIMLDGKSVSEFRHDDISYPDSRYINAQLDMPFKARGRGDLQHISPLPGSQHIPYKVYGGDGIIHLNDTDPHEVVIDVRDANKNLTRIRFKVQYDPSLSKNYPVPAAERFVPNEVNVFERDNFELFTTELSVYDTITAQFKETVSTAKDAISPLFQVLGPAIPAHDHLTVRLLQNDNFDKTLKDRVVIKNISGSRTYLQKASWQNGWYAARFRQFGTYQAFLDTEPPTVNNIGSDLSKVTRIVFTPKDNFNVIKSFRAELNGQWLRFTNDKGRSWIYTFDEHFPRGNHTLKVTIEDEAGNVTVKSWNVRR
ncbi:MAG: peptidoglycan DD-metalloendopeptidase family protein [Flavisolibacter sp.]